MSYFDDGVLEQMRHSNMLKRQELNTLKEIAEFLGQGELSRSEDAIKTEFRRLKHEVANLRIEMNALKSRVRELESYATSAKCRGYHD